jgi:signal transduction histidine kinase
VRKTMVETPLLGRLREKIRAKMAGRTAPVETDPRPASQGKQPGAYNQMVIIGAVVALLLVVVATSTVMVSANRTAGMRVLDSQRIPIEVTRLMIFLQRAESSQRGYLLTGNKEYRDLYDDSIDRLGPILQNFTETVQDNPTLRRELAALLPVFDSKISELNETIALFESGRLNSALDMVRSNEGKRYMDQIREGVGRIWTDAQGQSEDWIGEWRTNSNWLFAVQIAASCLVLMVAGLAVMGGVRHTQVLETARRNLLAANESLEEKVQQRTADLIEANEEVQKFAYIISHDLRSPLVNIMGFTAELDELRQEMRAHIAADRDENAPPPRDPAVIDDEFTEALGFIRQSTTKMDRLISAVLKLARSGQREFKQERIDMNGLIAEIAGTMQHRLGEAGATIEIGNLPELTSDRLALEQTFGNLLDNAIKYLDDNRPGRIAVRGYRDGSMVVFDVEDNGRGIDQHDLGRIFELFRRGGKQDKPGEGIGLAHLRVLVRRLGGKITCRSEFGRGSVFSVQLPIHGRPGQ